ANGVSDVFVRDQSTSIAPFASWDALIDQQYVDFLARPASAAEIATWKARITNGESTVGRFIDTLAHGPAWSAKRGPLLRLYWAFFLREPDAGGLSHWLGKYESGTPLASIAGSFATSKEFKDTYGPLVDAEFVKLVYGNVLQRKSEASGVAYWVDQLQHHGLTRGAMMGKFSESPEGRHVLSPYVDVLLLHLGLLRALPTKVQFEADAFGMMTDAHPAPDLAETLRLGGAYASRFP
ncbi:MAG: hypothetical protein JWM05_869, partial [Acidimicrobiales bacterium]|nr:hypothetical protein [Acidimicrobiales bacterium]